MTAPSAAEKLLQSFERRADRAARLAPDSPAEHDVFLFASELCRAQGRAALELEASHAQSPFSGSLAADFDRVEPAARGIFRSIAGRAPAPLAEKAESRSEDDRDVASARLLAYWAGDHGTADDYLSRAALRPYAEVLRSRGIVPNRIHRRGHCPACGAPPAIACRRDGSLMEGARRFLGCMQCGAEWPFERILCPSCFEEDPLKLPSFRSDRHSTVRIEACETCRRYVKSIDLSEDARPIPEIDDLLSLSMDLWAAEQGFTRIEPGLAGL